MPCDENIDIEQLQLTVTKLLDKAGTDARLTPRLLREKVEQRMKLEPDALKSMKPEIMTMITEWWIETHNNRGGGKKTVAQVLAIESLSKFAKAVGKGPHFFKSLNCATGAEKADDIRKRLQDEGYEVSKIPSTAEIEEAKRKYELKKEISDIDQSLILTNGKRRHDEQAGSSNDDKLLKEATARESNESNPSVAPHESEGVKSTTKKMKPSDDTGEDEEAEAQF